MLLSTTSPNSFKCPATRLPLSSPSPSDSSVLNSRHHHKQRPSTPTTTTTNTQNTPPPSVSLQHTTMSPIALPTQTAVVCHGARDMRVEDRVVWPPHQNEAQVRVVATGLCGSDCEYASPACPHNVASPLWLHPLSRSHISILCIHLSISLHSLTFALCLYAQYTTTCTAGTATSQSNSP